MRSLEEFKNSSTVRCRDCGRFYQEDYDEQPLGRCPICYPIEIEIAEEKAAAKERYDLAATGHKEAVNRPTIHIPDWQVEEDVAIAMSERGLVGSYKPKPRPRRR